MVPRKAQRSGPGLHTGQHCEVSLRPGPRGSGWWLNGAPVPELPVRDTRLATTLGTPSGPVMTVEHLFAALAGLGVADAVIEVEGGEVPALDGSAQGWVEALAGFERPGLPVRPLRGPLRIELGEAVLTAEPYERPVFAVTGRFPGLGEATFECELAAFEAELAPARTFGYTADAPALHAAGRALGASLDNCVPFDRGGAPLVPLRFPDEPFRHKCLDLLGDLGRLGFLPRARVHARCAGHAAQARLAAALLGACT